MCIDTHSSSSIRHLFIFFTTLTFIFATLHRFTAHVCSQTHFIEIRLKIIKFFCFAGRMFLKYKICSVIGAMHLSNGCIETISKFHLLFGYSMQSTHEGIDLNKIATISPCIWNDNMNGREWMNAHLKVQRGPPKWHSNKILWHSDAN